MTVGKSVLFHLLALFLVLHTATGVSRNVDAVKKDKVAQIQHKASTADTSISEIGLWTSSCKGRRVTAPLSYRTPSSATTERM